MADILDYHLQHYLRRFIRRAPEEYQADLKSLRLCGQSVMAIHEAVYLLTSNKGQARFYGHNTCKNPFACPVCSAKMMEHYRSRIATAIELLKPKYFGFMGSFAIPHLSFMSCKEVMEILNNTWAYCRHTFKNGRKHGHSFAQWKEDCQLTHHVKVLEHTWGKAHGWHAHYHCIFWIPRGFEKQAAYWEAELNEFWLKTAKRETLKYWKKHKLHTFILESEGTYDNVLNRLYRPDKFWHKGVYFSKDKEGNLREVQSGDYLCGWGADNEVTGNIRKEATYKGHMTPYQILTAAKTDRAMEALYIEFCLAVRRFNRVRFSQTGINKLIDAYQKEHGRQSEIIQKKKADETPTRWSIVAYFDKLQWYELCCLDRDAPVLSNILYLASKHIYLLGDYLSSLNIYPDKIPYDYTEVSDMFKCG